MNQDTLFSLLIGGVISVSTEVEPATLISFEASFKRPLDLQQAKGGGSPMAVVEQDGRIFVDDPESGTKVNEVLDLTGDF